ncbi:MAG: FkbM family methyltransferase [Gammaproteobacteria bacterium]|nr:FkbM family methyltransferase [Gammaproteobacteria bacterium]
MPLDLYQRLHMVHRCWRLRFKSEAPAIRYTRNAALANCTALDIGAHRGVYSIYLSRAVGPGGRVIAFEAQPELGEHLAAVRESFGLGNLTVVNEGLSSQQGTLLMRRHAPGARAASFHKWADEGRQEIAVPVMKLDDYAKAHDIGPVSFIRCSVQGHELDVFSGGARLLARDKPALLFRCHEFAARKGDLFELLTGLGFDGYFFYVTRADHRSPLRRGRAQLVPCDQEAAYPYLHPDVRHRYYLFVPAGRQP